MSSFNRYSDSAINLADLENLFFAERSEARQGALSLSQRPAMTILHIVDLLNLEQRDSPLPQELLQLRQNIDLFLAYCGILEVACIIDYASLQDIYECYGAGSEWEFSALLDEPELKYYYETVFPMPLVTNFVRRMLFGLVSSEPPSARTTVLFQRFLSMELSMRNNAPIKAFFRMLETHPASQLKEGILSKVLASPEQCMSLFAVPVPDLEPVDLAIVGLERLLSFCLEYDALLRECSAWPEFQQALWSFYSPHFLREERRLGDILQYAILHILTWPQDAEEKRQSLANAEATLRAVNNLVYGVYRKTGEFAEQTFRYITAGN